MATELTGNRPAPRRKPLLVALTLLLAATTFAGWSGWQWYSTATDDSLESARARDVALDAGRTKLATLTSMDYRTVDTDLERWKRVTTGDLRDRLTDTGKDTKSALHDGGSVAKATVLGAGLTELNTRSGTATMIATLRIKLDRQDGPATTKRNRFEVELRSTEQGWKLSGLTPVPLGGA